MHPRSQDLSYALRQLRRAPVFALTAVLTLALGIGANTAVFFLLDQALLRSLPVRDPASLHSRRYRQRLGRSLLQPADPTTLLAVILLVVLTSFVAALLPARCAITVDPTVALRTE